MSKHTPGPWRWSGSEIRTADDRFAVLRLDHGYENGDEQIDVRDEDAKLMAAAPEMLKLLRAEMDRREPVDHGYDCGNGGLGPGRSLCEACVLVARIDDTQAPCGCNEKGDGVLSLCPTHAQQPTFEGLPHIVASWGPCPKCESLSMVYDGKTYSCPDCGAAREVTLTRP